MAKKKPLLGLPGNALLVSNLQRSTKALLWKEAEGGFDDYLFWMNAQYILF